MFSLKNYFSTSGQCAVFYFIIVLFLALGVSTVVPSKTSERYCSETRTENKTEKVTTQIPCNQTYTARCGWFSLTYCTKHRIGFCPLDVNRTRTVQITEIKCCSGFKITRRKTCIPLDEEEPPEEEYKVVPEEEYKITTALPPFEEKEDEVVVPVTSHPHFPDVTVAKTITKKPDAPMDTDREANETDTYETVDKTKTDFSKNQPPSLTKGPKKLSSGAFAGIVCGGVFIGSVVGLAAVRIRKRQRKKKAKADKAATSIEIQHLQSKPCSEA